MLENLLLEGCQLRRVSLLEFDGHVGRRVVPLFGYRIKGPVRRAKLLRHLLLDLLAFHVHVFAHADHLTPEILIKVPLLIAKHAPLMNEFTLTVLCSKVLAINHTIKKLIPALFQIDQLAASSLLLALLGSPQFLHLDQLLLKLLQSLGCLLL
jgi:hypothetical protein